MDLYRDYFTREQLLLSLAQAQYIPGQLAEHFETLEDVYSTSIPIEELAKDAVSPSDPVPRGAPSDPMALGKARVVPFETKTYSREIPVLADSVLNARRPGSMGAEVMAHRRDRAAEKLRNWADIQHEWLRVSCVNAPSNAFGTAPGDAVVAFGANDSAIRSALHTSVVQPLEAALDGLTYTGIDAYCSDAFWLGLIESKTIKETYLGYAAAAELRGQTANSFVYGDIAWHRYRPQGGIKIADGRCKIVPRGVPGLLVQAFAPDDTNESVGEGLASEPYYLRAFPIPDDKGWRLKMQTHPVMVCTRPEAIQTLKLTA
ncbi:elements of external origin [Marichromatium purpuratum 984]|uniref:Elements of external origin n=1 Tax=Marichromatium purpuratum 984 TaxID=765910 RepID=W0E2V9_MARPU|nr:minor capsid protein E [Marichromatium purpuratum]AHF03436.1 elements of external origin [Marichromatium purpuratum 984]